MAGADIIVGWVDSEGMAHIEVGLLDSKSQNERSQVRVNIC